LGLEKKGLKNHDWMATGPPSTKEVSFLIPTHSLPELTCYGEVVFGPAATAWYKVLEKFVVIKKSALAQTVARVAADQLAFAPVGIAAFFSAMTVLEGGNTTDVKKKLDSTWWSP
jgi:protein Mpv17